MTIFVVISEDHLDEIGPTPYRHPEFAYSTREAAERKVRELKAEDLANKERPGRWSYEILALTLEEL